MSDEILSLGKHVLEVEARSILSMTERIDETFLQAAKTILACQGKLVTTGIGKSGIIARKLTSTFSSTGTPSLYLHPAESAHGDLGVIGAGDVVLALSNSGESSELAQIMAFCTRRGVPVIAMTGNRQSMLGRSAKIVLNSQVSEEA